MRRSRKQESRATSQKTSNSRQVLDACTKPGMLLLQRKRILFLVSPSDERHIQESGRLRPSCGHVHKKQESRTILSISAGDKANVSSCTIANSSSTMKPSAAFISSVVNDVAVADLWGARGAAKHSSRGSRARLSVSYQIHQLHFPAQAPCAVRPDDSTLCTPVIVSFWTARCNLHNR